MGLSRKVLELAEQLYLRANGWRQVGADAWTCEYRERYGITQGHAVNAQKQHDRRAEALRGVV